jgi:hypothetical protein
MAATVAVRGFRPPWRTELSDGEKTLKPTPGNLHIMTESILEDRSKISSLPDRQLEIQVEILSRPPLNRLLVLSTQWAVSPHQT